MLKLAHVAIAAAILYCIGIMVGAFPAVAAVCAPWEDMLRFAYTEHGELPAFISVSDSGLIVTVAVNDETHTYTVFAQPNAETMCAVSSGQDWRPTPEAMRKAVTVKREKT